MTRSIVNERVLASLEEDAAKLKIAKRFGEKSRGVTISVILLEDLCRLARLGLLVDTENNQDPTRLPAEQTKG